MAHLLAMNVPVKKAPEWSDWSKMPREKIKSAGVHVHSGDKGTIKKWKLRSK